MKPSPLEAAEQDVQPTGRAARVGLWALILGCIAALLWAGLAPLDEGVPSAGLVAIDTKRKPVQHQIGGIVKEVLVREGDEVREGQVLLRLDDAVARSNFEALRQRYLSLRAMQGRLEAEQGGLGSIRFHADLQGAGSDPLIQQQMLTQQHLFASRRAALQSDLRSMEESIQGQEGSLRAFASMLASRRQQQALVQEELKNTRPLVADGYVPRNRLLELERMVAEIDTALADLQGNSSRATHAVGELKQRLISRQKEYGKEVESQLADVTREVQSDEPKFKALREELGRTEVKAPVAGQVMTLSVQAAGSVVQAGQKLMDVVPSKELLLLEARVAPHLIDRVRTGLPVDVRFAAFAHSPQLVIGGTVSSISRDLLTEPQTNQSYYLARVSVTPQGQKALGERRLYPGMPVEVVFKTGERSLLTYWLHPLLKRMAGSMKEE